MLEIKDSVAVITGGGGGIGFAVAKHWVQNGGKVVLGDVAQEPLDKAAAEIEAMNGEVATVVGDVTNAAYNRDGRPLIQAPARKAEGTAAEAA